MVCLQNSAVSLRYHARVALVVGQEETIFSVLDIPAIDQNAFQRTVFIGIAACNVHNCIKQISNFPKIIIFPMIKAAFIRPP